MLFALLKAQSAYVFLQLNHREIRQNNPENWLKNMPKKPPHLRRVSRHQKRAIISLKISSLPCYQSPLPPALPPAHRQHTASTPPHQKT